MNLEQAVSLIIEALKEDGQDSAYTKFSPQQLGKLIALVEAAEREACAKLCDELRDEDGNVSFCIAGAVMTREDIIQLALEHFGAVLKPSDLFEPYKTKCAAAIRARNE